MRPRTPLIALLLTFTPLAAQATPAETRKDSLSFGAGLHNAGPMLTFMVTGPRLGLFSGWATSLPSRDATTTMSVSGTESRVVRQEDGEHQLHLGLALRLNHRLVVGLGLAHHVTSYRKVLQQGSDPWSFPADPGGDLTERRTGPLIMADLRVGARWGFHGVAGTGGVGVALTRRF